MIDRFRDDYDFLSNFYPVLINVEGIMYTSAEHAFQAMKTLDRKTRIKLSACRSCKEVKALGRKAPLREDWEQVKLGIMETIVREKFKEPSLRRALLNTGDEPLVEGNTWGDTFWGVCRGKGENHLGKILMKIREEIKQEELDRQK